MSTHTAARPHAAESVRLRMMATDRYFRTSISDPIEYYASPWVGHLYRNRVARCVAMLPPGARVLEIGYGSGVSFLNLSERFEEIHGVDLHDQGDEVRRTFPDVGDKLRLQQGNILDLPFADGFFDAVLAISLHEHLQPDEQAAAFNEVRRVVRPGGCYVVGVPGVNRMMTAAFCALRFPIEEHHFSTEGHVLREMRRVFDVDVSKRWPLPWPGAITMYLYCRGWKRVEHAGN